MSEAADIIMGAVCGEFDMTTSMLRPPNASRKVALARGIAARLMERLAAMSPSDIGRLLRRDQRTIRYALDRLALRCAFDNDLAAIVHRLEVQISDAVGDAAGRAKPFDAAMTELRRLYERDPIFVVSEARRLVTLLKLALRSAAALALLFVATSCTDAQPDAAQALMPCAPRDLFLADADGLPVWRGKLANGAVIEIVERQGGCEWAMFVSRAGVTCLFKQGVQGSAIALGEPS
jgi:hypothetical protein